MLKELCGDSFKDIREGVTDKDMTSLARFDCEWCLEQLRFGDVVNGERSCATMLAEESEKRRKYIHTRYGL